jgi:hypothetical protein
MSKDSKPVPCSECNTPVAEIQGDLLIIKRRHHGEEHTTVIRFSGGLDINNIVIQTGVIIHN